MTPSAISPRPWPSVLDELYCGRVRWDLLQPFPEQDSADRRAGDPVLASLAAELRAWIDPAAVDETRRMPDGLLDMLRDGGYLALTVDPRLGGMGLSLANAFRVIELAASWSAAVGYSLAIANGFGSASYLPVLPDGPLKRMIAARVADGIVSGGADAEAAGTANATRTTVAVAVEDGAAFELTGEKVFIGNGPLADLIDVSATVTAADGTQEVRLFFVDTRASGFTTVMTHEFMGLRGAPIGMLRLESVRVPAEHLLDESGDGWRMRPGARDAGDAAPVPAPADPAPDLAALAMRGRNLVIGPTSAAIAKLCLAWSRDFVSRRVIDGRKLAAYDAIQRIVSETAADVFTIESVAAWSLLGHDRADMRPDMTAVKNVVSLACWRTADRTLSLLGGEGYETAPSKARRGAPALPVERAFRDARSLRVAGGVDFMLDAWAAQSSLASRYDTDPDATGGNVADGGRGLHAAGLSTRCREHARVLEEQARSLGRLCDRLTSTHPQDELFARQRTVATVGRIANELLTMMLVLARAADLAVRGNAAASDLADVACTSARQRLDGLWPQLDGEPEYARLSAAALGDGGLEFLLYDVLLDPYPPASQKESVCVR